MRPPSLSDDAATTLEVLRQQAMDGYRLQSRTALKPEDLFKALRELQSQDLVLIKGPFAPDRIGDIYVSVLPAALQLADFLISSRR
jgi:hypothetical protein